MRGGQCWGAARDSQGSRSHIQPSPRGQPVLMGSLGCSAHRAWLVTRKEEQAHCDSDFNPLFRAPIAHPALLSSLPLETPGRAHMTTGQLSKAVQTPLRPSQSAQQMKTGGNQPCCTGVSCPLCISALIHTRRWPWDRGHVPFPALSPKGRCALSATLRQGAGTDKGRVLWDLAPLPAPATARPSPAPAP